MNTALLIVSIFMFCYSNKSSEIAYNNTVEINQMLNTPTLLKQIDDLKTGMIEYMKSGQPQYSISDVEKCVKILEKHILDIENTKSREEAMRIVESTVLKLNELNDNADSELIETGEREIIATIIISASHAKGYNSMDEDITEDWREW